jgi:valyl-tRNA synthetase
MADTGGRLANESFVSRAKPEVVERERERHGRLEVERAKLVESLALLASDPG